MNVSTIKQRNSSLNNSGFILAGALVAISLCSMLALSMLSYSNEFIKFVSFKDRSIAEANSRWKTELIEFNPTHSTTLDKSSSRKIAHLGSGANRIYFIETQNDEFPLLFDWKQFHNFPQLNCTSKETSLDSLHTSTRSCKSAPTKNRAVNGNLHTSRLEVSRNGPSALLIRGDLKLETLELDNKAKSVALIIALGAITIESLEINSLESGTLVLFSESSRIEIKNITNLSSLCGATTDFSNLKIIALSPYGVAVNGYPISGKKTAKCAVLAADPFRKRIVISES